MNNDELLRAGRYLVHLIDCGLHSVPAQPMPRGISWRQVHDLAAYNSVQGVSWFGAETRDDVPSDIREQWSGEAQMTLFRRVRFDAERECVFRALAREGLSYLPLKGVLLASYYPRPEMRSMADNDFLYGFVEPLPQGGFRICGSNAAEQANTVERGVRAIDRVMRGMGYKAVSLRAGNHESFEKAPIFNFEPHRRLVSPSSSMAAYFENPWKRAIQDEIDPHLFRLSDENEYVYVLAHAFKHFDSAGCGIRFVIDVRVFLERKGASMNWSYVYAELEMAGLLDFEARVHALADAAFGGSCSLAPLPADSVDLLCYLLASGTYGSSRQATRNTFEKQKSQHEGDLAAAKRGYLAERLMNDEAIGYLFPRASRISVLRPALQIARYIRGFVRNPKKIAGELKFLLKAK